MVFWAPHRVQLWGKYSQQLQIALYPLKEALILEKANRYHIPNFFIDPRGHNRESYDRQVSHMLHTYEVDLIVLIGYMRIVSAPFVKKWRGNILNVHPSLLPAFANKMDLKVHEAVLESGATESGCTVHEVIEEVDACPIIIQKRCPVLQGDTAPILKARVQQLESDALIEAIQLKSHPYLTRSRRTRHHATAHVH